MNLDSGILKKYDVSEDGFIDIHEYVVAPLHWSRSAPRFREVLRSRVQLRR